MGDVAPLLFVAQTRTGDRLHATQGSAYTTLCDRPVDRRFATRTLRFDPDEKRSCKTCRAQAEKLTAT